MIRTKLTGPSAPTRLWERSRLEWRLADGGDPAALVEDFLADQGLAVRDLSVPDGAVPDLTVSSGRRNPTEGGPTATLLVSAAAGAYLAGLPAGAGSPAPEVPDLVAVVWEPGAGESDAGSRPDPGWRLGRWRPSWSPRRHARVIAEVRAAIARGDVYQVNVVGHAAAPYRGDPLPALRRVAALPGARYAGILAGAGRPGAGTWAVACASPETLLAVSGGRVVTRPIKGTRPATAAGRAALLDSVKERAEHVMIVDLERNELARVARTGTVRVDELYAVRRWCDLWQAESVVSAALADGTGLAQLLRATCPGGSVTGAPKRAACELIAGAEPVGRGPSMGALGWVGPNGELDLGLTIRTVAVAGDRVHLWAGGGITWGSDPDAEVAEAAAKARPLRGALAGPGVGSPGLRAPGSSGYETLLKTADRTTSTRSKPSSE
jgi:para-aminobenzoate synthetase component 1